MNARERAERVLKLQRQFERGIITTREFNEGMSNLPAMADLDKEEEE